jgi:mono/diheme cytochrome c family protein
MLSKKGVWAAFAACAAIGAGCAREQEPEGEISFKADVQPVLKRNCVICHRPGGEGYAASGLSLESYASLMKGANRGPVVEPGSSASSILVRSVQRDANLPVVMPHRNPPLPKEDVKILKDWVDQGALDN